MSFLLGYRNPRTLSLLLQIFLLTAPSLIFADEIVPTSIHLHSKLSSGAKSISEMARLAKKQGIKVLIVTDLYQEHYEYGIGPLKKILKKNFDRNSIMRQGIEHYLNEIKAANALDPDVLIIDGTAVTPYHYWSGSLIPGPLVLNNRGKDLLVIGLGDPKSYKALPVTGNKNAGFDPYAGDAHAEPYQQFIDHVNKTEGLVFWSHPDANEHVEFKNVFLGFDVYLDTPPYEEALLNTFRYTGFGVSSSDLALIRFPNQLSTPSPHRAWDQVLQEYCDGKRIKPIWVIGEADYNGFPGGVRNIGDIINMVFASAPTREAILSAIRKGHLYVIIPASRKERILLDEFSVSDDTSKEKASMGEHLILSATPTIHIRAHLSQGTDTALQVLLIRNRRVIARWKTALPLDIQYQDPDNKKKGRAYYRIIIYSENTPNRLLSNPIFTYRE